MRSILLSYRGATDMMTGCQNPEVVRNVSVITFEIITGISLQQNAMMNSTVVFLKVITAVELKFIKYLWHIYEAY